MVLELSPIAAGGAGSVAVCDGELGTDEADRPASAVSDDAVAEDDVRKAEDRRSPQARHRSIPGWRRSPQLGQAGEASDMASLASKRKGLRFPRTYSLRVACQGMRPRGCKPVFHENSAEPSSEVACGDRKDRRRPPKTLRRSTRQELSDHECETDYSSNRPLVMRRTASEGPQKTSKLLTSVTLLV